MKLLTSVCFMMYFKVICTAQGLVPDSLFGVNGLFRTGSGFEQPIATLRDKSGNFIIIGNNSVSMAVQKIRICGGIDSSFGTNGRTITKHLENSISIVTGQVISDEKIILAGSCIRPGISRPQAYVIRLKANGQIDSSFGTTGRTYLIPESTTSDDRSVSAIRILEDGKILCAGYTQDRLFAARLKVNGIPDSTFGKNGFVYLKPSLPSQNFYTNGTGIVLNDGRILLKKQFFVSGSDVTHCFAIVNTDGTFETGIGVDGLVNTGEIREIYSIQQRGEKFLGIQMFPTLDSTVYFFRRWNSNLTPDLGFGNDGKMRISGKKGLYWRDYSFGLDGRCYLFGDSLVASNTYSAIIYRFNSDFSRDLNFGKNGRVLSQVINGTIKSQRASHCFFLSTGQLMTLSTSGNPSLSSSFSPLYNCFTEVSNVPKINFVSPLLNSSGQGSFQWQFNNQDINGANSQTFEPVLSGLYRVALTDSRACRIFSKSLTINFTGVKESPVHSGFNVFPNPVNSGHLNMEIEEGWNRLEIISMNGKSVYSEIMKTSGLIKIPVSNYPSGFYWIRCQNKENNLVRKVFIENGF